MVTRSLIITITRENLMITSTLKTVLTAVALTLCAAASAETRIVEVWSCTLRDGKTMEQVMQANVKWLEFVNGQVKGGGVESYAMTPIVGDVSRFTFADTFPDMTAWSAAKAALRTPAGQAAEAGIISLTDCTANSLYESTKQ
jgi:hypothetical protein